MKFLLTGLLLLLFILPGFGQGSFIKTIDAINFGINVRAIQTSDRGIAVFSLDSLKLYKFNSCGNPEWARQYSLPIGSYPGDFIKTQNGGFALLNRVPDGQVLYHTEITILDATGVVVWSKTLENQDLIQYPYTINQDANGDFIILNNASPVNSQGYYNCITKLSGNGNLLWNKSYSLGPIWGGAIVTSDNGILARIGNTLIKTDQAGNMQWIAGVSASSHHLAPIEVSDGYIFSGYLPGPNKITFHKFDKQGNLLWGGRKVLDYTGNPPLLCKKSNGNFIGIFNKFISGWNYTTIIEFDKDLAIVRQSTLDPKQAGVPLQGLHVGFSDENATVLAGLVIANAAGSKIFFGKTNDLLQTGCDTMLTTNIITEPVQYATTTSSPGSQTFNLENKPVPVKTIAATTTTLCSSFFPVQANIGSDSLLCENTPLTLQDKSGTVFDSYLWSTGDTTPTTQVTQPGKYWLRATSNCGTQTTSDTVTVSEFVFPPHKLTADTAICGAKPVLINAEMPGATYKWPDGSTNPFFYATKPGKYEVEITVGNCSKKFSTQIGDYEKLNMPNIFTPNNDGHNDTFSPMEMCGIASGTLKVYNRWGQLIYETSDIGKGWNGRVNGQKSSDGVYFYLLEYTNFRNEQKMKKGWVELVGG